MLEKRQYMKIWDAVKLLLWFILIQTIVVVIITIAANRFNFNENHPLINSVTSIIALIFCLKNANKKFNFSFGDSFKVNYRDRSLIPGLVIIAIGLSIVLSELGNYLVLLFPMSEFMTQIFNELLGENVSIIGGFIGVVIVAPIVEEILMRGIILEGFTRKYSNLKAIIISSLLFGIIHLNIYQFVAAFIIGLFLGWLYVKTRSLWLCIITHGFYNSGGFIVSYLLKLEISGYNIEGFQPLWFTGLGFILLIVGGFLLRRYSLKYANRFNYY